MAKEENKVITPFEETSVDQRILAVEGLLKSHVHDGRETRTIAMNSPIIFTGTAAPTTIPKKIGDIFINTSAGKVYVSAGTSASSDWKILN